MSAVNKPKENNSTNPEESEEYKLSEIKYFEQLLIDFIKIKQSDEETFLDMFRDASQETKKWSKLNTYIQSASHTDDCLKSFLRHVESIESDYSDNIKEAMRAIKRQIHTAMNNSPSEKE